MSDYLADVAVIGAGIVGVCIAYQLRKRGIRVVLVDKGEPGKGCSFGNSGAISPGSVAPLAMPGVLASIPSMLGRPDSPLFLPWRYLPHAIPWLTRFVWSARPSSVAKSAAHLALVHKNAVSRHEELAREVGVPELILHRGHLHLYRNEESLNKDKASWCLRERHGISFERVDRGAIRELEPEAPASYHAGVFLSDHATICNPFRYVQAIFDAYTSQGGSLVRAEVTRLRSVNGEKWQLDTPTSKISARRVVVAGGAWSRRLLDPLGIKLALETQRGYHVQFLNRTSPVSRTVVLTDKKIYMTPMEDGLRVGGTVELAGLHAGPNLYRAAVLAKIAKEAFPALQEQDFESWMGHRPCMPDSVPVVGPSKNHPGLWIATGHGHLGLTDSVGASLEMADGLCGSGVGGLKASPTDGNRKAVPH